MSGGRTGLRARWRDRPESLRGSGAPLQWSLMLGVLVGAVLGFGSGWLLGFGQRSIQSALVAAFVMVVAWLLPPRLAPPVAALLGAAVLLSSVLADATTGHPVWSGLAMALVMFVTSVLTASVPLGLLVGMAWSYVYLLVSALGVIATYTRGLDAFHGLVVSLVGVLSALLGVVVVSWARSRHAAAPAGAPGTRPDVVGPIVASLRTFDRHARDGVRRGLALGIGMTFFQVSGSHDGYWILLAAFVVLLPNGRSPLPNAVIRVVGTFLGALSIALLSLVLPDPVVMALGGVALLFSLAYAQRSATMAAALGAMAAVVVVGVPHGEVLAWAATRLVDTVIGATLALVFGYLLWPKDKPEVEVPATEAVDA